MGAYNSGIRKQLGLDSKLYTKMVEHSELIIDNHNDTAIDKFQVAFNPKQCYWLGVCVCKQPDILHFFQNLSRIFRKLFWKRKKVASEQRKLLDRSSIFLEFRLDQKDLVELTDDVRKQSDGSDELDDLFAECVRTVRGGPSGPKSESQYFYHIGYINLSTFHFAACEMAEHADHRGQNIKVLSMHTGGANSVYSDTQAVQRLDLAFPWKMVLHTFSFIDGDWNFNSDNLFAVTPVAETEFLVWQGSVAESARRAVLRRRLEKEAAKKKKRQNTTQTQQFVKKRKVTKKEPTTDDILAGNVDFGIGFDDIFNDDNDNDVGAPSAATIPHTDDGTDPNPQAGDDCDPYLHDPFADTIDDLEATMDDVADDIVPHDDNDTVQLGGEELSDLDSPESGNEKEESTVVQNEQGQPTETEDPEINFLFADETEKTEPEPASGSCDDPTATARAPRGPTTRSTLNRDIFDVPGLGELRYYILTDTMTAVCSCHPGGECRRSATTAPQRRGSGRPIGHLIAWLQQGHEYDSRNRHVHECRPSLSDRQAARRFFQGLPGSDEFSAFEKEKSSRTDPDEPVKV